MTPDGAWRLSPAYDLTYSVEFDAPAYLNRHSMTINAKNQNITLADLEIVALRNDIQDYKSLIEIVISAVAKFREYAVELNIDEQFINGIESDFVKL